MARNSDVRWRNVLIVRFTALGDVAMTVPVVYSACAAYPHVHFVMATREVASSLFINAPGNLTVVGVDIKGEYAGLKGMVSLAKYLKTTYDIDAVIDLQDVLRSWALSAAFWLKGVKVVRLDKGRSGKNELTRRRNKRMLPLTSGIDRYHEAFRRLGFVFDRSFVSLYGAEKASADDYAEITAPKREGERWVAIAPFAKYSGKIYPLELMAKVVAEIASWPDTKVMLMGNGDKERDTLRSWAEKCPERVFSVAERHYGFPAELALMSHCDVMVSMDSANMHLASLVRVPVVSVWGATHPYCGYMGWKQSMENAVQLNMACRPCSVVGDKPCYFGDGFCLSGIAPQLIIDRVKRVLSID